MHCSAGRHSSLDDVGDVESPTMASVLTRAPLLRLDQVQLEEAAAQQRGEEDEGEGETAAPPSPRRLLLAVIPAGRPAMRGLWRCARRGVVQQGGLRTGRRWQAVATASTKIMPLVHGLLGGARV